MQGALSNFRHVRRLERERGHWSHAGRWPRHSRVRSRESAKRFATLVAALATVAASLVLAGTGATATTPAASCPGTIEYPFSGFGDANAYVLTPGGSFEGSNGWTLTGGAAVVAGSESFGVHAASDSKSLSIPAGGSATSPATCVTKLDPTIRFFATGGSATSALQVDVFAA